MVKNQAFVFIKPHAVTDKVKDVVKEMLESKQIDVRKEGSIEAAEIDSRMLIDKHYYAIANKATLKKPTEINVPKEKFSEFFGVDFDDMVKAGKALNAKDACETLGVGAQEIDNMWKVAKKDGKLVKFGGGFYCAELPHGSEKLYVFNGFFMAMRDKYVAAGVSIYYYIVEWESASLTWEGFRSKVVGATDPAAAPADSVRGHIYHNWKELGLSAEPDQGDNSLHASASPFEAFAERSNWLGYRADRDPFGKLLLKAGVSRGLIKEWSNDAQVTFGILPMTKSIFDTLEDTDSDFCLALCQMIASFAGDAAGKTTEKVNPLEKEVARLKEQLAMYESLGQAVAALQAYTPMVEEKPPVKAKESQGGGKARPSPPPPQRAQPQSWTQNAERQPAKARRNRGRRGKGED